MTFLLDTNILSETSQIVPQREVLDWLRWNEDDSGTSSVVMAELDYGIQLLPPGKRRRGLETWYDRVLDRMVVLPFDIDEAREYARLMAKLRKTGDLPPTKDAMIAATALVHGLTVVTRNVGDFERSGVVVLNPFL